MADEQRVEDTTEEVAEEQPNAGFRTLDYSGDIEIEQYDPNVVEEPAKDSDEEDLRAQLAALQAKAEANSNADVIAQGFQALSEQLKKQNQQQPTQQTQQATEDIEEFKKKLKDNFFDDPVAAMEQFMEKKIRETVNPALTQIAQTTVKQGKSAIANDPTAKYVLDKYSDEVEQLVTSGQVPFGPDTYQQAVNRVAANHLAEVVTHLSTQQAAETQEQKPQAKNSSPSSAAPASGNATSRPKVRVSNKRYAEIQKEADAMGLDVNARIAWLRENDPQRLKG